MYEVVLFETGVKMVAAGRRGGTLDARMTLLVTGVGGKLSTSSS